MGEDPIWGQATKIVAWVNWEASSLEIQRQICVSAFEWENYREDAPHKLLHWKSWKSWPVWSNKYCSLIFYLVIY